MSFISTRQLALRLAPWALPVALLVAWQGAVVFGLLSTRILPAPSAVLSAGWELLASGEIWTHLAISGWRAGVGFAIGGGIGFIIRELAANGLLHTDILTVSGQSLLDYAVDPVLDDAGALSFVPSPEVTRDEAMLRPVSAAFQPDTGAGISRKDRSNSACRNSSSACRNANSASRSCTAVLATGLLISMATRRDSPSFSR